MKKTYLECVNEAALKVGYKGLVEDLQIDNAEPIIDILVKAADMYAEQSNSHKHGVMQAEGSAFQQCWDKWQETDDAQFSEWLYNRAQGAAVGNSAAGKGVSVGTECEHPYYSVHGDLDTCLKCGKALGG